MSLIDTQRTQQAGKTKLTAVTITSGHRRYQGFHHLRMGPDGEAYIPQPLLSNLLARLGVRRGDAYCIS